MIWTLRWSFVARHRDLYELSWRAAARIDAALMHFAETSEGAELLHRSNPRVVRIRVEGADAYIDLDHAEGVAYVTRLYRRR